MIVKLLYDRVERHEVPHACKLLGAKLRCTNVKKGELEGFNPIAAEYNSMVASRAILLVHPLRRIGT